MSGYQKTAVVDFDNTISGYDRWRGDDVMGPLIPYAKDALLELRAWGWRVVVYTTRGNVGSVRNWLSRHELGFCLVNSSQHNPPGTSAKPIAEVFFEDRDAHCVGKIPYNWHRAMSRVRKKFQPNLDTHVDDASLWASWWVRIFVAPRVRGEFRTALPLHLDLIELRARGREDVAKDIEAAMIANETRPNLP